MMTKYVRYANGQFSAFEFHCNIAKQLIKCESFHCKYTMLFQLRVPVHLDNMKFLARALTSEQILYIFPNIPDDSIKSFIFHGKSCTVKRLASSKLINANDTVTQG